MNPSKRPLLLGHRGARAEKSIPENSFASFDLCLSQGCDGFEFDVRLSADGQAVIFHDATCRGRAIVSTSTQDLQLPLLRDALQRYQTRAFLDIELKVPGLEEVVLGLLKDFPPKHGFVLSSFLPDVLHALHRLTSEIPLGLICQTWDELGIWQEVPVQCVIPHRKLLDQKVLEDLRAADKKILLWTVNSPADIKRFTALDVDGLISDYPQRLAAERARRVREA